MPSNPPTTIIITPVPHYLPDQSDPEGNQYVFAYTITIENQGPQAAQLISRHWIITDGHNEVREVRGKGVVGAQPRLNPGESHTYTSGCALPTPLGTMKGSYQMIAADGSHFDVAIPEFLLANPACLH